MEARRRASLFGGFVFLLLGLVFFIVFLEIFYIFTFCGEERQFFEFYHYTVYDLDGRKEETRYYFEVLSLLSLSCFPHRIFGYFFLFIFIFMGEEGITWDSFIIFLII